jgi:hypothetical protein
MTANITYTCELCKRDFDKDDMKIQGVMLYGYHTVANHIERESPSKADRHICWDCARNLAIAFFHLGPQIGDGAFKRGDAVCPRRYGE